MPGTYLFCCSTISPGPEVRLVSYGIVRRLVGSYQPPYEKPPKLIHNSRKLVKTMLRSLNYILQYTPRPRSTSQLVDLENLYRKSQDFQMIFSPVVFKLLFESHCCFTISKLSQFWPPVTTEPFPNEPHRIWKPCITACRNNSKRGCGRKCKLC